MASPTSDRRQGLVGNTAIKVPVDCATAGPITLSGEQTIDGFVTSGSRVLVMHQADPKTNGIYDTSTAGWTRSADCDGTYDLTNGSLVLVVNGSSQGNMFYQCTATNPVQIGSSALTFMPSMTASVALLSFLQAGAGALARNMQEKAREAISVLDFIDQSLHAQIANQTYVGDLSTQLQAAINAAAGRSLKIPAGKYPYATTLQVPKAGVLEIEGEFVSYDGLIGAVLYYTGTGIAVQVGVDDGDPDSTGPSRRTRIANIHFTTASAATALKLQNTALVEVERCATRNFTGKILYLAGNVITRIRGCDIAGQNAGTGCYGVWMDVEYFGNFVTDIVDSHIFQVNHAGRFSEGRSLTVHNNTIENILPGFAAGRWGGVWEFESAGYLSTASFRDNYYETHQGWLWQGDNFTGVILALEIAFEDAWGSGDGANPNPGVGNLPRTKVISHQVTCNNFPDASVNAQAHLAMAAPYPSTTVFDPTTTVVTDQIVGREYEDALVATFRVNELLLQAGDFSNVAGATTTTAAGGALALTGAATTPAFWTNLATPQWSLIVDNIEGGWCCFVPNTSGDFDRCSRVITLTPVARTRYFVLVFTTKGWSTVTITDPSGSTKYYDSAASKADWHSEAFRFPVQASAASFTIKFGTNANNTFYVGEARLVEIGSAEYNEPGTTEGLWLRAAKRLLKRGAY